ncbi:CoA transferase, partial [Pseudomonas syringae pv. actinidiae]|nr:CoA transferase [Pseudomonas syringae pv. actinidiae]
NMVERVRNRKVTDQIVSDSFGKLTREELLAKLAEADIAFAEVNSMDDLAKHPHLRRIEVDTPNGKVSYPAPAAIVGGEDRHYGKVPAIDDDGIFVFDSNAILLYLAEEHGKFLPANTPANRAATLSWLMFIATGLGPYSGQAVHFKHFAPKDLDYANNRYQYEAHRHYKIIDDHLAKQRYMVGDTYPIVDMAF